MKNSIFGVVFCFVILLFLVNGNLALAQTNISVSMRVGSPLSTLIVSGLAAPNSTVTFVQNGVVIGTVLSSEEGSFTKEFPSLEPGVVTISLYYVTANGEKSSTLNQQVALPEGTAVTLYNIVLSPTINAKIDYANQQLYVYGYAVPNSEVFVFVEPVSKSYSVKADERGKWKLTLSIRNLKNGELSIYARSTDSAGHQSKQSETETLKLKTNLITEAIKRLPDGPVRTTLLNVLNPLVLLFSDYDSNSDGVISFSEAYDVMKTWSQSWKSNRIDACDVNKDSKCNIVDFSILLFYVDRN